MARERRSLARERPDHVSVPGRDIRLDRFGQALCQIYVDHICFQIVNWFALRHDAFSGVTVPAFALPRPLAALMMRPASMNAALQALMVFPIGAFSCLIADPGAKAAHPAFCRRRLAALTLAL